MPADIQAAGSPDRRRGGRPPSPLASFPVICVLCAPPPAGLCVYTVTGWRRREAARGRRQVEAVSRGRRPGGASGVRPRRRRLRHGVLSRHERGGGAGEKCEREGRACSAAKRAAASPFHFGAPLLDKDGPPACPFGCWWWGFCFQVFPVSLVVIRIAYTVRDSVNLH